MRPPQVKTVSVYGGDPLRLEYRFRVSLAVDAAYVDISDWGLTAQWVSSRDPSNVLDFDLSDSDLVNGVLVMKMTKAQTAAMAGSGSFDVQRAGEDGGTVLGGRTLRGSRRVHQHPGDGGSSKHLAVVASAPGADSRWRDLPGRGVGVHCRRLLRRGLGVPVVLRRADRLAEPIAPA